MIAYFATIPVQLYYMICHRLTINRKEKAALFVDKRAYVSRGLLSAVEELKVQGIFEDVIACEMNIIPSQSMTIEDVEKLIIENFDKIFLEKGYDFYSFKKIYTTNDSWDGEINAYFNMKKVHYIWLEFAKNYIPQPALALRNKNFVNLMKKYKAYSPEALYADACILESSDATKKLLDKNNKKYSVWNKQECSDNLTDKDFQLLFQAFHLEGSVKINVPETAVLLIKNSFTYLGMYTKFKEGFGSFSKAEIYSVMDKIAIDFFAKDNKRILVKYHIHSWQNPQETLRMYGENSVSLPNVPMEILGKYFIANDIKIGSIIGIASDSLEAIKEDNYNKFYPLGLDFARTWWFYISLHVAILFAKDQGFQKIYCNNILKSQLLFLANEMGYSPELYTLELNQIHSIRKSLIINDMYICNNIPLSKIDKSVTIIYLNSELCNSFFDAFSEDFAPIYIKKEPIHDIECDILLKDEIIWAYSRDAKMKKTVRKFVFERTLEHSGIRFYSDGISFPRAMELFNCKQLKWENEKLRAKVESSF